MQSIGLIVPSGRENLKKTFAQPKSKFNEQFDIATRFGLDIRPFSISSPNSIFNSYLILKF